MTEEKNIIEEIKKSILEEVSKQINNKFEDFLKSYKIELEKEIKAMEKPNEPIHAMDFIHNCPHCKKQLEDFIKNTVNNMTISFSTESLKKLKKVLEKL